MERYKTLESEPSAQPTGVAPLDPTAFAQGVIAQSKHRFRVSIMVCVVAVVGIVLGGTTWDEAALGALGVYLTGYNLFASAPREVRFNPRKQARNLSSPKSGFTSCTEGSSSSARRCSSLGLAFF